MIIFLIPRHRLLAMADDEPRRVPEEEQEDQRHRECERQQLTCISYPSLLFIAHINKLLSIPTIYIALFYCP